jgi:hypothetical protein
MFQPLYFIIVFLNFFMHIYSYMMTPASTATSVKGGCPMRHLSKLFTTSINTFGQFSPQPIRTTVVNPRSSKVGGSTIIENTEALASADVKKEALPWASSISATADLTYMPMLQLQLDIIRNLGMEQVEMNEKFVYQKSIARPARIGNMCFRNKDFRKVRLTYFDGGDAVQVCYIHSSLHIKAVS